MTHRRTSLALCLALLVPVACDDKKTDAKVASKSDAKPDAKPDAKTDAKTDAKSDAKSDAKTDAKVDAKVEPAAAATPTGSVLVLGAAKIFEKGEPDQALTLAATGEISMEGKPIGKLSSDGKMTTAEGKLGLEVGADGIVSAEGKPIGLQLIEGGGKLTMPEVTATMTFLEDGSIKIDPKTGNGPEMAHEGCAGPTAPACALLLTVLVMTGEPGGAAAAPPPVAREATAVPQIEAKADAKADAK
jgi:hypothetical protein